MGPQTTSSYVSSDSSNGFSEPFPPMPGTTTDSDTTLSALEWNSFVMHGFNSTSPPTPEAVPPAQQPQPSVPSEESITYQPLEEPEEEGEILVGMGLYDAPVKYDSDPHLHNYRSTMSQLLGTTYRSQEPTGEGLKLEESWQPPEEDEDEEGEDDADGDDEEADEETTETEEAPVASSTDVTAAAGGNWI